jgi:hypothetical protein
VLDRQIDAARFARAALEHALGCEHDGIVECPHFRALVADHRTERPTIGNVRDLDESEPVPEPIEPPAP